MVFLAALVSIYTNVIKFNDAVSASHNKNKNHHDSSMLFLQHCAHQNVTSNGYNDDDNYSKFCMELCSTFTPECESEKILNDKWGNIPVGGHNLQPYTQSICCQKHGMLRISVIDFFHVANADPNMTVWLDHGSALGQVRHNKTIIPWDDDVDLAFLVHNPALIKEESLLNGHSSVSWTKDATERLMERLLKKLKEQAAWKYINIKNNNNSSMILSWTHKQMDKKNRGCIQHKFTLRMAVNHHQNQGRSPSKQIVQFSHVGLNGVQLHNNRPPPPPPRKKKGGVANANRNETTLLVATKYVGPCFNTQVYSESFTYCMFPPIQCPYFNQEDATVWCPRYPIEYVKAIYGPSTMARSKAHSAIYNWSSANRINKWE